ncbi:MarR family winged helix-turn-helix transcriptional regulator [Actinoallomurus rhizosphaericola]|uniref:MarR family winged helix-turn-helix transcriptional regulator n=1 Tax=Actinoallomurus rhizosphaericola TaxID=2952536 RepID=UPI002093D8E9|nr:MarR family transcriptional regulator [Actinoallomurus rhizosphaericola]MCO5997053.1 MarR family transcriptional regulator [Actinoallomurus rhizosphaericola]
MNERAVHTDEALDVVIAMHRLMRRLRRSGHGGAVHPTQLIVLALLTQYGPLRIGEIARRVPCSQPTATTAVAGLLAGGYVDRRADPTDGRATQVLITEAGGEILRSFARAQAEVLAGLMSAIPADQAKLLLSTAPVLGHLADLPAPPGDAP